MSYLNLNTGKIESVRRKPSDVRDQKIKAKGERFEKCKEALAKHGYELYADHTTNTYWIWKDGNTTKDTRDPFDTLKDVVLWINKHLK